ncbi:MAG: hypothetical protein ACLT5W_01820 [Ruminococcus sp.]
MKRTMTNYEIIQVINKLDSLAGQTYPFQVARAISKTTKALRTEYDIYKESYDALLEKYYELDESGHVRTDENGIDILKEETQKQEATEAIRTLLNEEIEDVSITQFDESALEAVDALSSADYTFFDEYLIKSEEE